MTTRYDNIFFLDIFNKILKVNNNDISLLYDKDGELWFGYKDILISLGYSDIQRAKVNFNLDKNNIRQNSQIKGWTSVHPLANTQPHKTFINESGLYQILSKSTKSLARVFMDKYFSDIIASNSKKWQIYYG